MTINDTLKAKIDELDLDRRLEELTVVTQKAFEEAKGQLGSLAYDNRLKVDEWLHKATDAFDAKTEGKYSEKVAKFSASIEDLVDKVAEKRTSAGAGSTGSGALRTRPPRSRRRLRPTRTRRSPAGGRCVGC